ncbi:MAG: tetratricopeptide repeat protein [Deltaproteobacteria bacterium]|nr:tetratricopeptide repeat protein [Deltaproteobacteria bacterium]
MSAAPDLQTLVDAALNAANRGDSRRAVQAAEAAVAALQEAWQAPRPGVPPVVASAVVGTSLLNLGDLLLAFGAKPQARACLEQAVALLERAYTPDAVELGAALVRLGEMLAADGEAVAAEPVLQRALAIFTLAGGSDDLRVAHVFGVLSIAALTLGRPEEAAAFAGRALAILGDAVDAGLEVAHLWNTVGAATALAGRPREAAAAWRRALQLAAAVTGEEAAALGRMAIASLQQLAAADRGMDEAELLAHRRRLGLAPGTAGSPPPGR